MRAPSPTENNVCILESVDKYGRHRGKNRQEPRASSAYLRTSSAVNVGTDKDSEKRQRHAIQGFAERAGFGIVEEFYDAAVSGADPIETRAGFAALLDRIEGNGVRTVIVEEPAALRAS